MDICDLVNIVKAHTHTFTVWLEMIFIMDEHFSMSETNAKSMSKSMPLAATRIWFALHVLFYL